MKITINDLREKLELKKKESNADKKKIDILDSLFKDDYVFFDLELETAVSILYFLGIPEEEIVDVYYSLISPENYKNMPKPYISISNQR